MAADAPRVSFLDIPIRAVLDAGHDVVLKARAAPQAPQLTTAERKLTKAERKLTKAERKPVEYRKVSAAPATTKLKTKLKKRKASRTDVDLTVAGMEPADEFLASGSEIGYELFTPVKLSKKEKAAIKKAKATAKLLKGKMGNWNFFQKCCRLLDIPASIPDDVVTARTAVQLAAGKKCFEELGRQRVVHGWAVPGSAASALAVDASCVLSSASSAATAFACAASAPPLP